MSTSAIMCAFSSTCSPAIKYVWRAHRQGVASMPASMYKLIVCLLQACMHLQAMHAIDVHMHTCENERRRLRT
eukprot:2924186-Pleurochrysis_carterae.AAC.1